MKVRKRLVSILLVLCLIALIGCRDASNNDNSKDDNSSIETTDSSSYSSVESFESSLTTSENETSSNSNEETSESSEYYSEDSTDNSSEEVSSVDTDSSEEGVDKAFVNKVLSPTLKEDLVWTYANMQMFNASDFKMSDDLAERFKTNFERYPLKQSVMLIELETGMSFAYKQNTKIGTASSIKGPFALYAYKCLESGMISWDTAITYQERHFQEASTGKVQTYPFGTQFSLKTLMDYMVRISDNQAYLMIKSTLGRSGFENMMAQLGCTEIIPSGGNWGYITAKEMASAWREIYYYSLYNENGAELFDRFMHAQYNYIWRTIPQYEAAHKSGWSGKAFNDAGVVFADGHEYVLVVLVERNGVFDDNAKYQFQRTTKLLAELMVEYNYYLENGKLMDTSKPDESSDSDDKPVVNESSVESSRGDSSQETSEESSADESSIIDNNTTSEASDYITEVEISG